METKRDWWVEQYYPFEAGSDGYPRPGQVVAHYRLQMKLTQADIAQFLGISERAVWSMEHTDAGLDSLLRRKTLCEKLEIPLPLLRLDALHKQDSDWLAKAGYPRFKLGVNGYPRPGEVVRYYRRLMSKEGRKRWSQTDMGNILGMYENEKPLSEKAVREMEKKDIGLDSITRREALVTILGIPPVLLGLDALHMPENALSIAKTMPPRLPKSVGIYQQKLTQFQTSLDTYWESHYSNTLQGGMREIEKVINELHSGLPYVSERQQRETRVVLCHYHQLAVDIARETRDYARVFAHANNAITLAKGLKDTELIAVTLLQRGEVFFDRGVVQNDLTAEKTI